MKILLDVANYEYPDLVQLSLLLINQYFSLESSLFHKALKCQLLENEESKHLYDVIFRSGSEEGSQNEGVILPSMEQLTEACWLKNEFGYEPHQINQNIILSFGKIMCVQMLY